MKRMRLLSAILKCTYVGPFDTAQGTIKVGMGIKPLANSLYSENITV